MNRMQGARRSFLTLSISLCFFFSGAAGLVYEIVWTRMLGLTFGHTVFALTTVLAAFMAGLALGAFLFGKLIDRRGRPLRVYALLEIGVGLYALLIPFLFGGAQTVYIWLHRTPQLSFPTFGLAQFLLAFFILLIPTTLMGASLPVLVKFFVDRLEGLGRKVADLYAINTFGAVAGSVAAGFFLLPTIGVETTTLLAAAVNLGIGAWALLADRWVLKELTSPAFSSVTSEARQAEAKIAPGEPSPLVLWLVIIGIGLSGASSMVYEVAWTRALALIIGSSIYAFSAMLTTFLVGLALGSFWFARIWGRRPVNAFLFGWLEIAVGFSALALVPTFERMPDLVFIIFQRTSPTVSGALLVQFALSFSAMIIPTTIIGATLPCAAQICARVLSRLGDKIGQIYSANTTGCIVGAIVAGFLLVPWIGAQSSMLAAAAMNITVGAAVLVAAPFARPSWHRRAAVPIALLLLGSIFFLPSWDRRVMVGGASVYVKKYVFGKNPAALFRETASSRQLLFYREGINSTVAVERTAQMISLKVNGKVDASNGADMMTQLMLGHLPVFLHPQPERVLVIGLGSGVTAGAVAQHPVVREVDVIELEPAVVEAANFFLRENRNVLRDPKVRLVAGDGRNFILATAKHYDVISSEPSNPWMAGVANLFSLDFYRLARQHLADDGIMVQWVHGYSIFPRELKMIVKTFRQVFPHATLWRTLAGDYLLVGRNSPLSIDYSLIKNRIAASAAVREDMTKLRLDSPLDLLTLFFLDEADLARFAEGAPVNTDDRPLLEFSAPLALYAATTELNTRLLTQARSAEFPQIANLPAGALEGRRLYFARLYWARGEKDEALNQLRKAPQPAASDVGSRMARAKLLFSLGEVGQASTELAGLARLRPQDILIRSYLKAGTILRELKVDEAMAEHGRTRLGDPNPAEAHNNLGLFYIRLGIRFAEPAFFDLAVDSLEASLRIEPESYAALNNLGNAYFELGKLDEAARAYGRVIHLVPYSAEARFNLGLVHEKQRKLGLAVRDFKSAVVLNPYWELPRKRLERLRTISPAPAEAGKSHGGVAPQSR